MANQAWRSVGGTNKLDKMNYITAKTLISNNLTTKQSYVGNYDICGSLFVSDNATIYGNTTIHGYTVINDDLYINGTAYMNNISAFNFLNVTGNARVDGDARVDGNVMIGSTHYLYGTTTGIGVNTQSPSAILDISGSTTSILNVGSTHPTNTNIIARNNAQTGIAVSAATIAGITTTSLQFFSDNPIQTPIQPDAQIKYVTGGNLFITAPNTNIASKLSISNRQVIDTTRLNNETAVIYDISTSSPFLYNYYGQSTYNSGNALSLITDNSYSNTFLNIVSSDKQGMGIGAGSDPSDTERSMGTIGLFDNCGNYVPVQTMVSGSNNISQRVTMGINKYNPITETYVVDINGPVKIDNGEITNILQSTYTIMDVNSLSGFSVAVGDTYINYSNNGGKTWNTHMSPAIESSTNFPSWNTVSVCSSNYAVVGDKQGYIFYTFNGGNIWARITSVSGSNNGNINSIYSYIDSDKLNVYISYSTSTSISYFNSLLTELSNSNITDASSISPSGSTSTDISANIIKTVNSIHGCQLSYLCIAGVTIDNSGCILIKQLNPGLSTTLITFTNPTLSYKCIRIHYDSIKYTIIAVGNGGISWINTNTLTELTTFTNVIIDAITFNDVYIYDSLRAVAVGNGAAFYYTVDGCNTWNPVSYQILNSSGLANVFLNSLCNFTKIYMNDLNSFVITSVSQNEATNIYYCYLPNLLNHANNKVLDICGNMQLSGGLTVDDSVYINQHLIVNNYCAIGGNLWLVQDASMNSNLVVGGNTNLGGNLTISQNTLISGNLWLWRDASMNANLVVGRNTIIGGNLAIGQNASISGNLFLGRDASMNSNLLVGGNTQLIGNLVLGQNATISGNLWLGRDASMNSNLVVGGNLFLGKNVTIGGNLWLGRDASMNSNLVVGGNSQLNGNLVLGQNATISGNLWLWRDASMNSNLLVGGNTNIVGNLVLGQNATIGGNLWLWRDASMNSNLLVGRNTNIGGNLVLGQNATIGGNLWLSRDASMNANVIVGGNLSVLNSAYINNIYGYTSPNPIINIGTTADSTVNIGGSVVIGSVTGSVTLWNAVLTGTRIENAMSVTYNSTSSIIENIPTGVSSARGGIFINDKNNPDQKGAYMIVSLDTSGILFKTAPSDTVVNMSIRDISLANPTTNIGLVALKRSGTETDSSFTMISYDIDVSNILLRNGEGSTSSLQSISTDITILGNTSLNGNTTMMGNVSITNTTNSTSLGTGSLQILGGASISGNVYIGGILQTVNPIIVNKLAIAVNPNMMMDISGNATITRLGLNVPAISSNATLAIRGNIIQTLGFIQQF